MPHLKLIAYSFNRCYAIQTELFADIANIGIYCTVNYDWSDIIDLEMRDSRWGADVLSCEHMFSHDVTVPYNNRHLSDLMLMVPLADRIADRTHIDFTHELCPAIDATNISVRDVAHNNKRMWMDKIYYFITSIRPF